METEAFKIESFIDEIEKRPAIWDMTSSIYSDKSLRRRAWEELVLTFCEEDDNKEKKKLLSSSLQKKWKSLRDNYMKEVSIANKDTECSFDADNASASSEVADVEISSSFKSPKSTPRKKQNISYADERFASILEQSLAQKNVPEPKEDNDEDKRFCLSLVKEIKKIPEYKRLRTKISFYNLILQNQISLQVPQHQLFENQNYQNPLPERRNYLSQEQSSQAPAEGFHEYRSQQSSVPNNLVPYGYTTAMSPVTHTRSPAPTNASNESELLFSD